MLFEGFERLSDGLQEDFAGEAGTGITEESGDAPAGGLQGLDVAYPTLFFLDLPRRCREQVGGLEFVQHRRLLGRQFAVGGLEYGLAQGFGHGVVLGFGLVHRIDRLGEELDDTEPVDCHVGLLESLADGRQEPRPAIRRHLNVKFIGPLVGIQPLSDQLPGRRHPKPQGKHIVRMHRPSLRRRSPAPKGTISCRQKLRRFHLERRGAVKPNNASMSRFLTIAEVAEQLRVNQKTVRRWIDSGQLQAYKLGRQWRISERDLQHFLRERWSG